MHLRLNSGNQLGRVLYPASPSQKDETVTEPPRRSSTDERNMDENWTKKALSPLPCERDFRFSCLPLWPRRHSPCHFLKQQLPNMATMILLLLLLSSSWRSSAQFAIPGRYDGFVYKSDGEERRPVWEVFIDPLCVHCKAGWPTVIQVAERYGSSLNVIVHPFPASFHHNSFFASRALHIAQITNASLVYPLLELIFENQETYSNLNTKNETPVHVVSRLVSLAGDLDMAPNVFEDSFNDGFTDQATRLSFKYGCSRGVIGTPTYLVNGVAVVGANDGWTVDDWAKIFNPMMKPAPGFGMTFHSLQS